MIAPESALEDLAAWIFATYWHLILAAFVVGLYTGLALGGMLG